MKIIMRIRKIFIIFGASLFVIFAISGIETIREELNDQKLQRKFSGEIQNCEESLRSFLGEDFKRHDICFCTEKIASAIDHILYRGSKNFIRRPVSKTMGKIMSLTALPVCLLCDTMQYTTKGIYEAAWIPFSEDREHQKNMEENFTKVKRCLLAFVTFPSGIVSADLVSQHFVTNLPLEKLIVPYGKLYSSKSLELYPRSHEDVVTILKEAKRLGKRVTFAGALMSQGKQALPKDETGILIHFDYINHVAINTDQKIARVGAGALWCDVQAAANAHGLAVKVMQASNIFSIGGSLSINCHGWDHTAGTLKKTVHSLLIANCDGELQRIYPGDDLFDLVIGGLGGFGAIIEADLSLTTNTKMAYQTAEMPIENYVSYFKNQVANNEKIKLHYFRLCFDPKTMFEKGIALNYLEDGPEGVISEIPVEPERGNIPARIKLGIARRLHESLPLAWKMERAGSLRSKNTNRNEAMTFHLRSIFNESTIDAEWLQEYFVPGFQLNDFLHFLGEVLKENNVPIYNASVRYVKQNESSGFSYSRDNDMFAVVLFFNQSLQPEKIQKTRLWIRTVIDYLKTHHGTYYLPYQNFASLEQFHTCYPEWEKIAEKKKHYDPEMRFTNGFYEEYMLPKSELLPETSASHFRRVFSDPVQRGWVEDFLTNVFMQLDKKKFMTLVDDILTDPDANDEIVYRNLQKRLNEGSFSFLKKNKQILKSLFALQKALTDQMKELMGKNPLKGYVEIGYPGRFCRPLKKALNLKGPFYVIHDKEQLADYIESGFPRPYDRFICLNEYEPIRHQDIATGSVDLVAMYIGLHHIPKQKLIPFLQSVHRVLRPGGSFVLMDHDATSLELQGMLSVIHSIFNVGTGISLDEELREFRNFQRLGYWESLLEKNGFIRDPHPSLVRQGDATLNSLVRFTKKVTTEEEFCSQAHA